MLSHDINHLLNPADRKPKERKAPAAPFTDTCALPVFTPNTIVADAPPILIPVADVNALTDVDDVNKLKAADDDVISPPLTARSPNSVTSPVFASTPTAFVEVFGT